MQTTTTIAHAYIDHLAAGDMEAVIALFAPNGQVHSPIYGQLPATEFYHRLAADTQQSRLEILGVFTAEDGGLALYFNYHWLMANGEEVHFAVVDILQFNSENKIEELQIIYDTVQARVLLSKG